MIYYLSWQLKLQHIFRSSWNKDFHILYVTPKAIAYHSHIYLALINLSHLALKRYMIIYKRLNNTTLPWYGTLWAPLEANGRTRGAKWIYACNFLNLWECYVWYSRTGNRLSDFFNGTIGVKQGAYSHQLYLGYELMNWRNGGQVYKRKKVLKKLPLGM